MVEVVLWADAEAGGFEGNAGHNVDECAGDIKEFFDLQRGKLLGSESGCGSIHIRGLCHELPLTAETTGL